MDSYFSEFSPDDSVGTREVDITISGQRHPRWRQDILLLKSLYKFRNFFFGHLEEEEIMQPSAQSPLKFQEKTAK
jgi:hypothetical protein